MPPPGHIHVIRKILLQSAVQQYSCIRTFGTIRPSSFQISCYPTTKVCITQLWPALLGPEANAEATDSTTSSARHLVKTKASKGRQQLPWFWFSIWTLYHQLRQVIVMLTRKFTFLPTQAFLLTYLSKHYVLNNFCIYKGQAFHFLDSKASASFSTAANFSSQLLLFLPVSGLCAEDRVFSVLCSWIW